MQDREQWPYAVVILDMIGDKELQIYRESYSEKSGGALLDKIYAIAKKNNITQFRDRSKFTIYDDHYPFVKLDIPSIVLIDFDYPHWHKLSDTLEKCSPESLFAVFSVMAEFLDAA